MKQTIALILILIFILVGFTFYLKPDFLKDILFKQATSGTGIQKQFSIQSINTTGTGEPHIPQKVGTVTINPGETTSVNIA